MRYFILAGESSGDLHGSNLMHAIKQKDPNAEFLGFGGDRMENQGCKLIKHANDLSFMGFAEVAMNIRSIFDNFSLAKEGMKAFQPDRVILIDYPGFNLRMAKFAKEEGFHVSYYIAPQVWAWKAGRTKQLKAYCDQVLVILPFEESFLRNHGVDAEFVGHPLIDALENDLTQALDQEVDLALLPGSRKQELKRILPVMLEAVESEGLRAHIAQAPGMNPSSYPNLGSNSLVKAGTYALLRSSRRALVTSGTATLETALLGIPQAVCYKTSPVSYAIGKRLVKVKYISLVNLIFDKEVLPEYIQGDCNLKNLKTALTNLNREDYRMKMQDQYKALREKLGGKGASERAAQRILEL